MSLRGKKYWHILGIKLGRQKDHRDENSALGHHFGTVPAALALTGYSPAVNVLEATDSIAARIKHTRQGHI